MIEILNDMPLFVEVARQKSFTAAADILDIPLSTVSRRVGAMEKKLGVPLLLRNSRNVELTEHGRVFFEHCEYIVSNALNACDSLVQDMHEPAGLVRFSAHLDSYYLLFPCLDTFAASWPKIQLQIRLVDRWSDLISEPFDLEFRLGKLPDSSLRVRKIGNLEHALYVSPKLLEIHAHPETPEDLFRFPCIVSSPPGNEWTFEQGNAKRILNIKPKLILNSISIALDFAIAGHGVINMPQSLAYRYERAGSLVRLLPDWKMTETEVNIVMPNHETPRRVRLFIDHLVAFMNQIELDIKADMEK
ncbi:LysR family transcriptional regulator [Oxalobacter vibrioformis]|uniref:LysR family transcriptional regulator n=1 Tax=Oxalobacter vibrioformis TaxID=933080 RepID=A0A9E9P3E9_9BURK|nr:LysR family transcriptional regulator [Oxalobacter vibrioformis]NLC22975.1 LysR family transcriptional regulator [Oxalobacter sp.]WAW10934.1 LysR family transcriptional regulator [Oxalobacter vibrioformis]